MACMVIICSKGKDEKITPDIYNIYSIYQGFGDSGENGDIDVLSAKEYAVVIAVFVVGVVFEMQ